MKFNREITAKDFLAKEAKESKRITGYVVRKKAFDICVSHIFNKYKFSSYQGIIVPQ